MLPSLAISPTIHIPSSHSIFFFLSVHPNKSPCPRLVSSRVFLYCPPPQRCRLTEPCLALPCLPFMDLTASKSTSLCLTILCDATLSHSLDLLGFYQPCRISSWDMTTCTTHPPLPSHVTIPLGMHSETQWVSSSTRLPTPTRAQPSQIFLSGMMSAQKLLGSDSICPRGKNKRKRRRSRARGRWLAAFGVLVCFNLSPSNLVLGSSRTTKARSRT